MTSATSEVTVSPPSKSAAVMAADRRKQSEQESNNCTNQIEQFDSAGH